MEGAVSDKIEFFFTRFKHQIYKKGEILIRADDDPPGILYLKKGNVKMYAISAKGDELVINIFKPISFFPMSWAMNNTPNMYYYEAITEVEVWKAPKDAVVGFIKENPDVLYDLLSRVYRGTDGMETRMTYLMSGSALNRVIVEILISAKRFGVKNQNAFTVNITESNLANQAGTTRETVSRELKILKNKKLISYNKGQLVIEDLQKLEAELP